MRKTAIALGAAAGIAIAGLSAPYAGANAGLHATVSPGKPSIGQTVKVHTTGAIKHHHKYICIQTLVKKGVKEGAGLSDENDFVESYSSSKGVVKCNLVFLNFTRKYKGKSHSCPPTKADRKAGWGCGIGVANLANHKQFAVARFKF